MSQRLCPLFTQFNPTQTPKNKRKNRNHRKGKI